MTGKKSTSVGNVDSRPNSDPLQKQKDGWGKGRQARKGKSYYSTNLVWCSLKLPWEGCSRTSASRRRAIY
jgi:hypothetical protein